MSEALGLGHLIPEGAVQHRDAIHIAVVPVTIDKMCRPGQKVGLVNNTGAEPIVSSVYAGAPIGVIDPFLAVPVMHGQRAWLYLYPGSITALRHEWTHPAFDKEQS